MYANTYIYENIEKVCALDRARHIDQYCLLSNNGPLYSTRNLVHFSKTRACTAPRDVKRDVFCYDALKLEK